MLMQVSRKIFISNSNPQLGGPSREYYSLIIKEIFDPKLGLFKLSENGVNIQINQDSQVIPSRLNYFQLAGIILAKVFPLGCHGNNLK